MKWSADIIGNVMTREEFVRAVKIQALDTAVNDTVQDLDDPPGRIPRSGLIAAHQWYSGLDESSRAFVEQVARMAAESAVFGVFAILDGMRRIEAPPKGKLVLEYKNNDQTIRLNDMREDLLHDLLAALFDSPSTPANLRPLDMHHVPQCSVAIRSLAGYTPENGTCMALPSREHKNIARAPLPPKNTIREQIDQDVQDLRDFTRAPESAIQKLSSDASKMKDKLEK